MEAPGRRARGPCGTHRRAALRSTVPEASRASLSGGGGSVPKTTSRRHPDTNDIAPTLGEIEQVGVEQRTDDVLSHNNKPNPRRKSAATEEGQMRHPHGEQHHGTRESELDGDGKCLVMWIL